MEHIKGKKGVIKNLFKNYAFLYNHDFIRTNGIFVEKTENLEIMGAELLKESNEFNPTSKINVRKIPEKFKSLIGETVKITGGAYKGHQGILISISDKKGRVELNAKCKAISVDKNFITDCKELKRADMGMQTPRSNSNFKTPAYYPQSPYTTSPKWNAGGQTPNNIFSNPNSKSPRNDLF